MDYMKEQNSSIVRATLSTHLSRTPATCLNHWELAPLLSRYNLCTQGRKREPKQIQNINNRLYLRNFHPRPVQGVSTNSWANPQLGFMGSERSGRAS